MLIINKKMSACLGDVKNKKIMRIQITKCDKYDN